jgi:signal transduction histidine kinase
MPVPSAALLTRRGLLGFGLVWQAAWMLADVQLWPTNQSHVLETVFISLSWVTWALLLVAVLSWKHKGDRQRWISLISGLNIFTLSLAAISISLLSIDPTVNDWITSASIFNLVAGLTGITVWNPRQWTWVFLICASELAIFIGFGFAFAGEMSINSVVLYPLYALAIGVAAASAQRGLINGAEMADSMAAVSMEREAQIRLVGDTEQLVAQVQRKVHETVLNTLTAISRGSLPSTQSIQRLIAERSTESVKVLEDLAALEPLRLQFQGTGLIDSIADLIEECGYRGITLSISGDFGNSLDATVEDSLVAAVREALTNSLRHSEATQLVLNVNRSNFKHYRITVEDNGVGFDAGGRAGYGLSKILKSDLEVIGATVKVDSSRGNGCTVQIDYSPHNKHRIPPDHHSSGPASNFVSPIISAWLLFSFVNIVMVWDGYSNPYMNALAFIVLATVGIITIYVSFSGSIPWWLVLGGSILAYLGYELEQRAIDVNSANQWAEWSSELIVAIFFVFAAAGVWWSWIVVGLVWLLIQSNWPAEFLAAGFVMIMTGAYLGWVLRRNNRLIQSAINQAAAEATQAFMSQLQVKSRYPGLIHVNPRPTIDLLKGVSSGTLDWESADVQHASAVHEAYIRNVLMSRNASASQVIGSISEHARDRGIIFESSVAEFLVLGDCDLRPLSVVRSLIEVVDPARIVRFTISGDREGTYFHLVGAVGHQVDVVSIVSRHNGDLEFEIDENGIRNFVWQGRCNSHVESLGRVTT